MQSSCPVPPVRAASVLKGVPGLMRRMSMYTSSPGDTEDDEEDEEDFLADEAPDVDLGRREIGSRSSSFPGAVNR